MKKKYLILADGLLALLGSAINVFAPVMILAMGLAAHKDFGSAIMALNSWNLFVFILAIVSRWLLKDEKRIKKWIPNLFLVAGFILFLTNVLVKSWILSSLEGPLMWLFGKIFGEVHVFTYFFYAQWLVAVLLVICGIGFLLSLKNFKAEN
ncbi:MULTISPECIES: hypothetical protein [Streptococcus]|uniref:hypothetical protein n=1 Tax=Streptococcus TaxID=1301 RepID=UPI000EE33EE5|nr:MULTISPECIES: hypothetical protein [Streptococcus]RJU23287.1 hypothetical protein DW930_08340 [Streptococcus sp. AM43-2AT]